MDQNFLNCQFCQNKYDINIRVPRMIFECGHSICSTCLDNAFKNHTVSITCPQDKKVISLLGKTQDIFPINQTVIGILQSFGSQKSETQSITKSQSPIRRVSDQLPSKNEIFTSFGTNVQQNSQLSHTELDRPSSIDNMKQCEYHNKELDTICFKCQKVICMQCALFDSHKTHQVEKIESFVEQGRNVCQQLSEAKFNIQNQRSHANNKYFEEIIKPLYQQRREQIKKDIRKCYKIAIANLKKQEEEVQQKIDQIFSDSVICFNSKFQNAFDDFKGDLDTWIKNVDIIENQNKHDSSIDQLFFALNSNSKLELIPKAMVLQKKMDELIRVYHKKAVKHLQNIKIEQKISYEEYFFDIQNPQYEFDSQLYNIDTNIDQDLFNEQLPDTNRDILPDISNQNFLLNDKPLDLEETNFNEDNLFQDVNVSEVSELSVSKVQQSKIQTFNPQNIHNIMLKHRKSPSKINFTKKITEPIPNMIPQNKMNNQPTLRNVATVSRFDILSSYTGLNIGDNFNRKTNSNKKLLSGQENASRKSRSRSKQSRSVNFHKKQIFKGEKGEIILKLQKDLITDLDLSYYSKLKRFNKRITRLNKCDIIKNKKSNNLKEDAIQKLCKNIQNSNVEEIDFSFNSLTEQGIKHILELVEKNRFLKKINLKRNQLPLRNKEKISNELKQKGPKSLIVEI